ncbi:MAG TPA: hypothetical protein VKB79_21305 [Bryobacteraceae bacterium]|nr:hypothetical protein [Bryobacteraceae bacterium]
MKRALAMLFLTLPVIASAFDAEPVLLKTTDDGSSISYALVNKTSKEIVGFDVSTRYLSGGFENLGCSISITVKSPGDLNVASGCSLPKDQVTGKPVRYKSRVTEVRFANGLKWIAP